MSESTVVVVGAGLGGLAAAIELRRRGLEVVVLERFPVVGGKACERSADGFRWDRGPSIVVMPWVYRTLFEAAGLDPEGYLPLRRLDPAFKVVLTDGRPVTIHAGEDGLRDAFAAIEPADADGLSKFLNRIDTFASLIGHAYCDRQYETWPQVMFSPLMLSAAMISPGQSYVSEIDRHFRSPAIRELLYGFPTFSGFDPKTAPASLAIIPWTIIREGVWYPAEGGIAAIPRALAAACRDLGVEIRTGVEVEAIELDGAGRVVGVATSSGFVPAAAVVSNSDYVRTHELLRGGPGFEPEVQALRAGRARPSTSFFTVEMACDRTWDNFEHHVLVLTPGSGNVYRELYDEGVFAADPPIYANVTSVTDPSDAPEGCSNPFLVVGAPPLRPGEDPDPAFEERYADQIIDRLEAAGYPGLRAATLSRTISGQGVWRDRFSGFLGSIYGLSNDHNILGGSFRPLVNRASIPGLYFVGGGVQPGPGMPMVIQGGKIVAEKLDRELGGRSQRLRRAARAGGR